MTNMTDPSPDSILTELDAAFREEIVPSALDWLARYDTPNHEAAWENDPEGPRIYRWFARKLIDQGYPTSSLRLARRRLDREVAPRRTARPGDGDPILRYLAALAFARGGNPGSAARYADPLVKELTGAAWTPPPGVDPGALRTETIALQGRIRKDQASRVPFGPERSEFARGSAEWYEKAAETAKKLAFPLGNAAAMRYVQGAFEEASRLAERALDAAQREIAADPGGYWEYATAAEACLILGRTEESLRYYHVAVDRMLHHCDRGALAALLPNLQLLSEAGLEFDPQWILARIGSVMVFSGHRIDPPWHAAAGGASRFPNDPALAAAVKERIATELERRNVRFGLSSLACGSDILFAEAILERRADLQVVLPFAESDFRRLSVDYGSSDPAWAAWCDRYRKVLGALGDVRDAVYFATDEPYLGSNRLFQYANDVLQGMTIVRARQLGIVPDALVVSDPGTKRTGGGAIDFLDRWHRAGHRATSIDLAELRGGSRAAHVPSEAEPRPKPGPAPELQPRLPRPIRAMLFADVAGFSRIKEEFAPDFFELFPTILADTLESAGTSVRLRNTWGDGVFVVFGAPTAGERIGEPEATGVVAAADFALRLIDAFGQSGARWQQMGFADPNPLRIGLHVGPVFELDPDPVLGRVNYFGQHVNRTARIEPITLPGSVFASEQFAALLTVAAPQDFRCEFVGIEPLDKGYATAPVYRIVRSSGAVSFPGAG